MTCIAVTSLALGDYVSGSDLRGSFINLIILISALTALGILRFGKPALAFVTFGWGTWVAITVQALLMGNLGNPVLFAYPVIIMLSGWLLGLGHGYAMCAASIAVIFGLAWMDTHGIALMPIDRGAWGRASDLSLILFISMYIASRLILHQQRQKRRVVELNTQLTETVASLIAREQQLSQAESRFAMVGDIIPAPLSLTDAATGEITYVNKAWESVLGWTQEGVAGKSPLELGIWFEAASREAFGAEFRRNGCVRHLEMMVQARDGSVVPVSVSADSVEQNGRRMTMSLLYDLTERTLVEAKIRKLNAELEARVTLRTLELKTANDDLSSALTTLRLAQRDLVQSEKLAALGGLVAGVSHELNTPIGNSLTVASTLEDQVRDFSAAMATGMTRTALNDFVADIREGVDILMRCLHRSVELVSSFKQVAADQTSQQRREFLLRETVNEILTTLGPTIRKTRHTLSCDIPQDIRLQSYPGPLGQVLTNLITNALIHGLEGTPSGRIVLRAHTTGQDWVELSVQDNGAGIAPEHVPRVFDPFFTTRLGQGGSGLGLHIAYNIVTQMLGGTIRVVSEPGQGAHFILHFPCATPIVATEQT